MNLDWQAFRNVGNFALEIWQDWKNRLHQQASIPAKNCMGVEKCRAVSAPNNKTMEKPWKRSNNNGRLCRSAKKQKQNVCCRCVAVRHNLTTAQGNKTHVPASHHIWCPLHPKYNPIWWSVPKDSTVLGDDSSVETIPCARQPNCPTNSDEEESDSSVEEGGNRNQD